MTVCAAVAAVGEVEVVEAVVPENRVAEVGQVGTGEALAVHFLAVEAVEDMDRRYHRCDKVVEDRWVVQSPDDGNLGNQLA